MKCRHNLRIRIVITRTSKHHQDIVEGTKSIPDLVYLRVHYIVKFVLIGNAVIEADLSWMMS